MKSKSTAHQLFMRIVTDSKDKIDRVQAVVLVANMLGRSPLDVGFIDIGLDTVHNWHPSEQGRY